MTRILQISFSPSGEGGCLQRRCYLPWAHIPSNSFSYQQNLTEAREDNNIEEVSLTVVEPYDALIQGPESVTRVEPGTTEVVDVTITATGSRTANWDLSYNTANLPTDWIVEPQAGTNLQNIELAPSAPLTIPFTATLPADALGDQDGYLEVTATLVSDSNVQETSWIPIEALRTRGLSLVGPTGLSFSEGYGLPGHTAESYVLIENLGNAVETTTSIDWTNPSWGGTPVLNDGSNNVYSITLQPGEKRELSILLDVPSSTTLGGTTTTTLTTCIGSGDDTARLMQFRQSGSHFTRSHSNSARYAHLQIHDLLPQSGTLSWDLNQ